MEQASPLFLRVKEEKAFLCFYWFLPCLVVMSGTAAATCDYEGTKSEEKDDRDMA
jgi:hypothetical protein